jgi:PLAT/LH2 domain
VLECKPLGALQRIRIRHDNAGSNPGWFVNSVTVQNLKTYREYNFPCYEWLAEDQADGAIQRELMEESKCMSLRGLNTRLTPSLLRVGNSTAAFKPLPKPNFLGVNDAEVCYAKVAIPTALLQRCKESCQAPAAAHLSQQLVVCCRPHINSTS